MVLLCSVRLIDGESQAALGGNLYEVAQGEEDDSNAGPEHSTTGVFYILTHKPDTNKESDNSQNEMEAMHSEEDLTIWKEIRKTKNRSS